MTALTESTQETDPSTTADPWAVAVPAARARRPVVAAITAVFLGVVPAVIVAWGYGGDAPPYALGLLVLGIAYVAVLISTANLVGRAAGAVVLASIMWVVCMPYVGRAAVILTVAASTVAVAAQDRSSGAHRLRALPSFALALLAITWVRFSSPAVALALLGLAVALVVARRPLQPVEARLDPWVSRGMARAERVILVGLMAIALVPLVILPVAVLTVCRRVWRSFWPPATTTWQIRAIRPKDEVIDAWGPWASAPAHVRRRRNTVGAVALGLAVVGLVRVLPGSDPDPIRVPVPGEAAPTTAPAEAAESPFPSLAEMPAFEGVEWANAIDAEHNQLGTTGLPANAAFGYGLGDLDGEFTTVKDGVRSGYEPSCAGCPTAEVWWFGGSVAFGWVARDEHTPSSELARVAEASGVNLDIKNLAVPGWTIWQEFQLLAAMLATTDELPDAVVFYDGFNDIASGIVEAGLEGRIETDRPTILDSDRFGRYYQDKPTLDTVGGPEAVAAATATKYRGVQALATSILPSSVPVFFVLQPDPFGSPVQLEGIRGITGTGAAEAAQSEFGRTIRAFEQDLLRDRSVLVVRDALDRLRTPVFSDPAHMNEAGGRTVAESIFEQVEDELREVAS